MAFKADFAPGSVWLVGAGPGDPGLLTLLAARALEQADVIIHDALIPQEILDLAGPHARLEYAGKRGGKRSTSQEWINARLIAEARKGTRVVRLKGGDPFVFGRGGEEALALAAAEIPFRIVPGVTAGIGGLAYAGVPVTHRGMNTAVTFVTGHTLRDPDAAPDVDWTALAAGSSVLVVYMGLGALPQLTQRLLAGGRAPNTPVALIANASLPNQKVVTAPLQHCLDAASQMPPGAPVIIVVGPVVDLHAVLGHCAEGGGDAQASEAIAHHDDGCVAA